MGKPVICRVIHAVHGFLPNKVLRTFLTIQILFACLAVCSQDVTVINKYNGLEQQVESPQDYVLKNVTEHTYIINEYELSNTGLRSNIDQMISYGLRSYIDNNYHVFDDRVEAIAGKSDFMTASANIVKNAVWIHDQPFADEFPGFSEFIEKRINQIITSDGYQILSGKNTRQDGKESEIGLYTFQRMVYDLKKACELEVGFFLDKHLPRTSDRGYGEMNDPYLSNSDYSLKPINRNLRDLKSDKPDFSGLFPEEADQKTDTKRKKRKNKNSGDNELTERVIELLEQNSKILNSYNDRFAYLQQQIDEVRNSPGTGISKEIAELRSMIQDLADGKTIREMDGSTTGLLKNQEVEVIFEKNKHELTLSQKAILNKAVITLRGNPGAAAFITGYADKTGDAELNAWISKKRAEAVRDYLNTQGVESKRLIVNFLGDAESESANPLDRKVLVKFVVNSPARN